MSTPAALDSLYLGLISGTSMDAVDAALFRLGERTCETLATRSHPYSPVLRDALYAASRQPDDSTVDDIGRLDRDVGECFRDAANELLKSAGVRRSDVVAIGSHGQTLRHLPDDATPFTLQIGDPNVIAAGTGITTIADFRRRDMAMGGEGAPLTPAFHHWLFAEEACGRVVLNIGGIANITVLPAGAGDVSGFDTGPGNTLMDAWISDQLGMDYDDGGRWALSGSPIATLTDAMLSDAYFARRPPKSTGFEYFNLEWLGQLTRPGDAAPADVQASLLALSARSIGDAIRCFAPDTEEILVCGGGVHNGALMKGLADEVAPVAVSSTVDHGLEPDWVEAAAFAWLASRTLRGEPGNLPAVTGARGPAILGGIYLCAR